ncbi:hypothetical protein [Calycomorphotria hydatis]|uniref:Uncharacterized protein n=1 Tax=Calycomorphotria hydatis TaxID=2528027 RepID=A0A517TBC9_9PLAN|nr:hypothetical protein [Calycomorphotria hydatis]QDT65681.1 hypothetical protein V22_29410 [Calycomorphotria hydatis]
MDKEPEKFTEKLNALIHAKPFRPFRLYLSDGGEFDVRHPEAAWLTKGGLYVGIYRDAPESDLPDSSAFCSLLHITRVEVNETASA